METIGGSAFYNNALTSVTIGNSVETIGGSAFRSNNLNTVTIPNSVTSIGNSAFLANSLTSVTIGNSVETIGDSAFFDNALTSAIIPDSVTTIGGRAFYFNALTSVAFLGNFGTFELNMFEANSNLTAITYVQGKTGWPATFMLGVSGSVDAIPSTFEQVNLAYLITSANTVTVTGRASGNSATEITIPDSVPSNGTTYSVTTIGDYAFFNNALTSVTIPDSVTTIGEYAFSINALTSVTIGNSVTTIGVAAFRTSSLTSVTIPEQRDDHWG